MADTTVTRNENESRYDVHVDGELAGFALYEIDGDRAAFTHTEIFETYQGGGIAGTLAGEALADTASRGLTIVPVCPYIARYLDRHEVEGATVAPPR
ncbi:GNAT family N-acetyltransferase [Demequina muriae]|uniref:GNAT family N-acetyltransferase n=1 Tax=Demequina muriae TaxID=3051664 RepID=A0ABT8GJ06_9MICO|nr:GNAT family N-acetyltransferase [Demequina sp. EGI L300058]MDN4481374.1 GNAT family N-acetyltransferase [Demequina sp. EGI L300058]